MDQQSESAQQQFQRFFQVWPEHKIIQCTRCKYAVVPTQIQGHLKDQHKSIAGVDVRKEITKYVREHVDDITWQKEGVEYPPPDSKPVGGFPLFPDGLRCVSTDQFDRECGYVCRTTIGMQDHCKKIHSWVNTQQRGGNTRRKERQTPNRLWVENQACQQFFVQGAWKKYFAVTPGDPIQSSPGQKSLKERMHEIIQAKQAATEARERRETIQDNDSRYVMNPWLQATQWARHLQGLDREQLIEFIKEVDESIDRQSSRGVVEEDGVNPHDSDFGLKRACAGTRRLIRQAFRCSKQSIVGRQPLFLVNRKETGGTGNEKMFYSGQKVQTLRKYADKWTAILRYLWRTQHRESRPGYELTTTQSKRLIRLKDLCRGQTTESGQEGRNEPDPDPDPSETPAQRIEQACLEFWISMLDHHFGESEYENGIISGLAVLGIDERTEGWKPATTFTPYLSAIISTARAMVVYAAYRQREMVIRRLRRQQHSITEAKARKQAPTIFDGVQKMVNKFMLLADISNKPNPMDWMMHIRTLGMRIRFTTNAPGSVDWQHDKITIGQASFRLQDLKSTIQGLCNQARTQLLHEVLLLDVDDHGQPRGEGLTTTTALPELDMNEIIDNPADTYSDKFNFLKDPRNKWSVDGENWMLDRVMDDSSLAGQFVQSASTHNDESHDSNNDEIIWNEDGIQEYFNAVQTFKEQLFVLVHLTAGAPARGTESVTVAYENGVDDRGYRGVFVDNGLVAFVTAYNKTGMKIIHRYVPKEVSELVVYYLWLVQPFVRTLQQVVYDQERYRAFLWEPKPEEQWGSQEDEDEDWEEIHDEEAEVDDHIISEDVTDSPEDEDEGFFEAAEDAIPEVTDVSFKPSNPDGVYSTDRCRRLIQEVTADGMGVRIGLAMWREIYPAIHRHLASDDAVRQTLDNAFGNRRKKSDMAAEAEEANSVEDVRARQAGHSLTIEDGMYGRMMHESPFHTMREKDAFRKVSIDWHRIVGFTSAWIDGYGTGETRAQMEARMEEEEFQRWSTMRHVDMRQKLKHMMGPEAEFRGRQQDILQALMQGHKNVLGIMPTGGGKSLTFMLPAMCSKDGVTIVVVPILSLRDDMMRRCKKIGIKCAEWTASRPPEWANIVLVTPEAATGYAFQRFIQHKKAIRQLDRIVIDECHVVLDAKHKTAKQKEWRPKILQLYKTVSQSVQTLFLTATLPPRQESEFCSKIGLKRSDVVMIRDQTTRKEITYRVVSYEKSEEEETLIQVVEEKKRQYPSKQIVVYCQSIKDGERYAKVLDCTFFHREMGTEKQKKEVVQQLTSGKQDVFVATNALGLGIDCPTIRAVIHIGVRRSMRDYAQESGRAGRDRQASEAIIMTWHRTQADGKVTKDSMWGVEAAMKAFVKGEGCRRVVMDKEMDGMTVRLGCEMGEQRCDVCMGKPRGTRRRRIRVGDGSGSARHIDQGRTEGESEDEDDIDIDQNDADADEQRDATVSSPAPAARLRFMDSGLGLSSSVYRRGWEECRGDVGDMGSGSGTEEDDNDSAGSDAEEYNRHRTRKRFRTNESRWMATWPATTPSRAPAGTGMMSTTTTTTRQPGSQSESQSRGQTSTFRTPQLQQGAWTSSPQRIPSSARPTTRMAAGTTPSSQMPSSPPAPRAIQPRHEMPRGLQPRIQDESETEAAMRRHQWETEKRKNEIEERERLQEERETRAKMNMLRGQCENWKHGCIICKAHMVSDGSENGHTWETCPCQEGERQTVGKAIEWMEKQIDKTEGISGCPDCFLPQRICNSWQEDQMRGYGLFRRVVQERGCQYAGVVKRAVAALMICEDGGTEREDWLQERVSEKGLNRDDTSEEVRLAEWLKSKVWIGRYETNGMCWFFNVWG